MVNKVNNPSADGVPSKGLLTHLSVLERRRFLFKSVGKGAALGVAVVNPLRASAQVSDPTLVCKSPTTAQLAICSVSGMQSAIGSRHVTTLQALGHSPGYWGHVTDNSCFNYGTSSHPVWGPKMSRTCPAYTWGTLVSQVLTSPTVPANVTLGMLMADGNGTCTKSNGHEVTYGKYSNTDDCHWICAIFNAATYYGSKQFPYDLTTIKNVANGVDTTIDKSKLFTLLKSLEGLS
jgi:hypothetical protein